MINKNERKYLVYKITNRFNKKIYIGCHSTLNINDSYFGSGTEIREAIKKEGKKSFVKEILFEFNNKKEMLSKEKELVTKEFCMQEDTYNRIEGGIYSNSIGMISVKDKDNNYSSVYKDDLRYLNGELVPVATNKVFVKDKNNNKYYINKNDERYLNGELIFSKKGTTFTTNSLTVKDKEGNTFSININDPRYLSGELQCVTKNKLLCKDKNNNRYYIDINDERYLSGELVHYLKGCKNDYSSFKKGHLVSEETKNKISKVKKEWYVNNKSTSLGTKWHWINNGIEIKRVSKDEINKWIDLNWSIGKNILTKEKILNFNINFQKHGWIKKLAELLNLSPATIRTFIKINMPIIWKNSYKKNRK